ncbi:MAG: RraA family protein [Bryobacteraceae bacterium]|nr:RraA family protein [Bryobacteraceae bacterium]MDW8379074.1 RraA family protein [Bryobacterales bacterium]
MKLWNDDEELFELARKELFVAVVGDVMDQMGLRRQFLPPQIQPLKRDLVMIGRAMPVLGVDWLEEDIAGVHNPALKKSFGLMMEALDSLKPNEIYTVTGCSPQYALWGELMSTRAMYCRAAGAVLNGYTRDLRGILALQFPVFCWGSFAQDQSVRGKVVDYGISIQIGQAVIAPGDILFGDCDGVCVVPRKAETEVFLAAIQKARAEKTVRSEIEAGMPAREAFEKYGIL